MGIFSNILGTASEKRTQLFIRDDGKLTFRRLDIMDASIVEKDKNKKPVKGWMDKYKMLFPFDGYRNIPAGSVSIGFDRSPLLDIWGILEDEEKLPVNAGLKHPLIQDVARNRMYKIDTTAKPNKMNDYIAIFCGAGMIIEIIGIMLLNL